MDLFAVDLGIEVEVEVFEGALFSEVGALLAAAEGSLGADVEFVLKEKLEEFGVAELVAGGFLESDFETNKQA